MGRSHSGTALLAAQCLWYAVTLPWIMLPTDCAAAEAEPGAGLLDEINQRWRGARCRLRIPVEIKKGKDSEGWSRSPHYSVRREDERPFYFRMWVSDRAALSRLLDGKTLRVGTPLVAKGWRLLNPKAGKGPVLELAFDGARVEARFEFIANWSFSGKSFPIDRLLQVERYMRLEALEVVAADEGLVEVAPVSPSGVVSQPVHEPSPVAPSSSPAPPQLRLLAVAVQPPRSRAGDEIALVVSYEVGGVPPGAGFEVVERREILTGDSPVTVLEERLRRASGTFTSSQPVRIPATLAPGVYTLRGSVTMSGREVSGSALFEVVAPAGVP